MTSPEAKTTSASPKTRDERDSRRSIVAIGVEVDLDMGGGRIGGGLCDMASIPHASNGIDLVNTPEGMSVSA